MPTVANVERLVTLMQRLVEYMATESVVQATDYQNFALQQQQRRGELLHAQAKGM
jgi:hypothetical protein